MFCFVDWMYKSGGGTYRFILFSVWFGLVGFGWFVC